MTQGAVQYSHGTHSDLFELGATGIEALGEPAPGRAHDVLWVGGEETCGCDDCFARLRGLQAE